eukprot:COSAG06_NODE_24346_length_665_cov_1.371025_1_plen_26_part_10
MVRAAALLAPVKMVAAAVLLAAVTAQ